MIKKTRIIEVIGPAGAGKSTLGEILNRTNQIKWIKTAPYFRRIKDFPFFATNSLLMLKTLLSLYAHKEGRWFTREEMAWMVILNGWSQTLRSCSESTGRVILVDEGPIFHLAYLWMRGPEVLHSTYAEPWWRKRYWQVANSTDLIVWLDASNEVLLRRIRTRESSSLFDSVTDEQIYQLLARLRNSYSHLVPQFTAQKRGLRVLMFDTEKKPVDEISEQILA